VELLRYLIDRVHRLLSELTDAANFTRGQDLTADRQPRKALLAVSVAEPPAGNQMAFEVADRYRRKDRRC
jgi:hypothetical protein